jgi:hypothetical protein
LPRYVPRKKSYDVVFVAAVANAAQFRKREKDEIRSALNRAPSPEFLRALGIILLTYKAHQREVRNSTAASIQRRIKAVVDAGNTLQQALHKLTQTDGNVFGDVWTRRFLLNQGRNSLTQFEEQKLPQFLVMAEEALSRIEAEPKAGTMPGFARRRLASSICQILFEETGERPTARKGSSFDQLLRFGIKYSDGEQRDDVADLMRRALKDMPVSGPRLLDLLGKKQG